MAQTVSNVSAGKPALASGVYRAAAGTTPPTDASTSLASAFKALGYCGDGGVVNSNSPSSTDIKAWGGDTVLTIQEEKPDTFKCTFMEALNIEVLKAIYGSSNVTGSLASGLTVTATSDEQEDAVWVIEMILSNSTSKRIVIPHGKITEIGDVSYTDSDAIGYEVTITALPDASGNTHYEYFKQATSGTSAS